MASGHGICLALASTVLQSTAAPQLSAFPQCRSLNWVILLYSHLKELAEEKNSKFLPLDCKIYLKSSSEAQPCFRPRQVHAEISLKWVHLWSVPVFSGMQWQFLGNILTQCPCRLPGFTSTSQGSMLCCESGLAGVMSPLFYLHFHVSSFFLRCMEVALLVEQLILPHIHRVYPFIHNKCGFVPTPFWSI